MTLTIIAFILQSQVQNVEAQSSYIYQAFFTTAVINDIDFPMGATKKSEGSAGFELNFWALPFFSTQTKKETILKVCNNVNIYFTFNNTLASDTYTGFGFSLGNYDGFGKSKSLSTTAWNNVNLRVLYGNYTQLNVWQGNNWYELNPTIKVLYKNEAGNSVATTACEQDSTLLITKTTPLVLGAYVGDFRIMKINTTDSWGQFIRHYENPFNNRWNYTLSYIYLRDGMFNVLPSMVTKGSYSVGTVNVKKIDVLRCNQSMAMQADGTCSMNCLTTKCLFCQTIDKLFYNICRYCDGVSSSCQPISKCPVDYYLENGICYKCPIGCSSCERGDLCTACDSGLVLNSFKQKVQVTLQGVTEEVEITLNATCSCPIGQFGTISEALDTVTCEKCDETCYTCAQTNVKCTSCIDPLFWIENDGGICIRTCQDLQPNYYGDVNDRICKPCKSNCNKCTSLNGCIECGNYMVNKTVLQLDGTNKTSLVSDKLLNAEGTCLEKCPTNSIDNSTNYLCHMCPAQCTECRERSINCTKCNNDTALYTFKNTSFTPSKQDGRCLDRCPVGFFKDTTGICKQCDESCTVCDALNFCTNCTMDKVSVPKKLYHFVNFQCKLDCGERFYPDQSDPNYYFCRSCPSNCLNCDNARLCTKCINDYYLTTINGYKLCVRAKECAPGSYPKTTIVNSLKNQICDLCFSNCKTCTGISDCQECFDGYFLNMGLTGGGVPIYQCLNSCPVSKFALPNGVCANCISNCTECKDALTCKTCKSDSYLLEDQRTCVWTGQVTCPNGYYLNTQNNCTKCKTECNTCTSLTVCTSCILGHTLNANTCQRNCGNGIREDREECDDGNDISKDGCAPDCTVEDNFICEQGSKIGSTIQPDICRCDPMMSLAEWTDYWGTIRIKFDSMIYYNSTTNPKSNIPMTFCNQILQPSTISRLGTSYACYLWIGQQESELLIDVGKDATIGNKGENYETFIDLIEGAILLNGCQLTGIPPRYWVKNLPLDTPQVLISGPTNIGACANAVTLNLATSKGLTKRDFDVTWTLISISPANDDLREQMQLNLDPTFLGKSMYTIPKAYVDKLAGKTVRIQVKVKNFLERSSSNQTDIVFSKNKIIEIIDLPDSITFQSTSANQLFPRFRLPYCLTDTIASLNDDYAKIKYQCEMYDTALTNKRWPLINCTIRENNMTIGAQYIVEVLAIYDNDQSYNLIKKVMVQPATPAIQVALIQGCNRLFTPNNSFSLSAIYNTDPKTTTFVWQCTDKATGSVCFSTSYKYITLGNSEKITVGKDIFFYGMQYEFKVTAFDASSGTNSSISCLMYSSGPKDRVIDVLIEGEATNTGFIDFTREQTAFKAFITNMDQVMQSNLRYTWSIKDSSEKTMKPSEVQIYQNSIGVRTSLLNRNSLYYVYVEVTDGVSWGNATQVLQTKPDLTNEFNVEPSSLDPRALTTMFSLSVYGQRTFETLDQYVFGYVDPRDSITKIPMTQKTYKKFVQFILPDPIGTTQMTCYVEVIMPNRVSMTFYKTVTVYPTDMTSQQFNDDIKATYMDDIVESMQMKHKLVSMRNKMTLAQRSTAIKKILEGLQRETTPMSNYYIQSSVGSLLEYISLESDSLLSDPQIVTVASQIFRQMTIGENVDLANGRALQYGKSVTSQLYNFANNLFMKDFTNLIGGQPQLEMKVMFMQGLKNVLKGSLSNMILGDVGGFSYQGQNIFAKAVKFDQLENQYMINSTLPKSVVKNFTTQNFVNISLGQTASNPCKQFTACQVSIIILDQPITRFISNSKDSSLKSMLVDLSIQQTEVSSPYSYITISDAKVENLKDPIQLTIPLYSELNTTNPNNTLACGYIDTQDNVFKQAGYKTARITNALVTCQMTHLTTIGVEEFSAEIKQSTTTTDDIKTTNSTTEEDAKKVIIINMWECWALYACFALIGVLGVLLLWANRRDANDEKDLMALQKKQQKIYVNLFLEPVQEVQVKDPLSMIPEKKSYVDQYQKVEGNDVTIGGPPAISTAIKGPQNNASQISPANKAQMPGDFTPIPSASNNGRSARGNGQAQKSVNFGVEFGDENRSFKSSKSGKKKGKKKKNVNPNDDFFNDGDDQIEKALFFEGGDDDDFFGGDLNDGASQPSKKKKKKKKAALDTGLRSIAREPTHTPFVIEDVPVEFQEPRETRPRKGKSLERDATAEQDFGGFNFKVDADEEDKTSKKSKGDLQSSIKKKKKKKKTTSRSKSINSNKSKDEDTREGDINFFHANPDAEAQVLNTGRQNVNSRFEAIPLEDFDGPDSKKLDNDEVMKLRKEIESGMEDLGRQDTQSKGFETLMNEELDKQKSEMGRHKKKKAQAKKRKEENEKKKKQKRGDYYEKEAANCVQFCIWNCKEAHRCSSLIGKYNQYLSRPSRIILLVGSWFLFILLTGFLVEGPRFVDQKVEKVEQFVCGTIAAMITRVWVVIITGFLIHSKQEKVYSEIHEVARAKRTVCLNKIRYFFGLFLVLMTIIIVYAQVFTYSARFAPNLALAWGWSTLFAVMSDLVVVDGVFITLATLLTMTVGAAPDSCGKCRNCFLNMVPEAIRNAAE